MFFPCSFTFSQVGINTETPQATLHLNGEMQISQSIYLGGDDANLGNAGKVGAFLKSNGPNETPEWAMPEELNIPIPVAFAFRKNDVASYPANSQTTVYYPIAESNFYQDSEFITYDSTTGKFKAIKDGYYHINSFVRVQNNHSGGGSLKYYLMSSLQGTVIDFLNSFGSQNTFDQNKIIDKSFSETIFLTAGEEIWIVVGYTSGFSITESSIAFTYYH